MRTNAKVDANHAEIVAALRAAGAQVQSLAAVGRGVPDVLVARHGVWFVLEIKDGAKSPSRRKLTEDELAWHEMFAPHAPVHVVETVEQALAAVGAI
jgi:hypothetical protein